MTDLTDRQREVLALVAEGAQDKEIAHRLGISKRTAEAHVGKLLAATGLGNRVRLAVWWDRIVRGVP